VRIFSTGASLPCFKPVKCPALKKLLEYHVLGVEGSRINAGYLDMRLFGSFIGAVNFVAN